MIRYPSIFIFLMLSCTLYGQSGLQVSNLGDFPLENKQVISDCRVAFRTFGEINADSSNIVLFPTWFGGTTRSVANFVGPGKIVDSSKYFVIIVGAFGNGESSSPSNSIAQAGDKFPKFTIRDMVKAQHLLLKKHLGLKHIYAVVGGSMGGMQTFEWLVSYPAFMNKAVAYVGTPRLSASDVLLHRIQLDIIEMGQRASCSPDSIMGLLHALIHFTIHSTDFLSKNKKAQEIPLLLKSLYARKNHKFAVEDFASQLRAMLSHDIFKRFDGSPEQAARQIKAQTLFIVSESDQIVNPLAALQFAPLINAQTMVIKDNGGHLTISAHMKEVSKRIADFLGQ